jgi:uncharacterized protein YecE (DUF72 family)
MLYQLPPRWQADLERLRTFVAALPPRRRHVVEFRDSSWYSDDEFNVLRSRSVAICLHDMPGSSTGRLEVGPFVYVRFHGVHGTYGAHGEYPDASLRKWAEWLAIQHGEGRDVFVYFNNDVNTLAPRDAHRLEALIRQRLRRTSTPRCKAEIARGTGRASSR